MRMKIEKLQVKNCGAPLVKAQRKYTGQDFIPIHY